jgi:hypothetical protein
MAESSAFFHFSHYTGTGKSHDSYMSDFSSQGLVHISISL